MSISKCLSVIEAILPDKYYSRQTINLDHSVLSSVRDNYEKFWADMYLIFVRICIQKFPDYRDCDERQSEKHS